MAFELFMPRVVLTSGYVAYPGLLPYERTMRIASEVNSALRRGEPVVALESTLISHGLPFPWNKQTALDMEHAVRARGALPATIGVLKGEPVLGLSVEEIEHFATAEGIRKCSRRDLPVIAAQGGDGTTTVAATMILAHRAGIRVFATGGIGGVHRGGGYDISADLTELARLPMTVVCAGAKSILDLSATLEVLETGGVPVIGYGTDSFPAFYVRSSGLPVDHRCDTPEDVAAIMREREGLAFTQSIVVACPVPEEYELAGEKAEAAIHQAVAEAEEKGIRGKEITPYVLSRVSELTRDESRTANIALLKQNAALAADIAIAASG